MVESGGKDTRGHKGRYHRARIRNFLFTLGPSRLTGGRITRRHLSRELLVHELEVFSPRWPEEFDGLRIGHVSDFHLGELLPIDRALAAVDLLAAQEPDLVACTGDVVDLHHDGVAPLLGALARIGAPLGTALVLGNHDELHCRDTVMRLASEAGLVMLHDDAVQITRNGAHLVVAGVSWARSAAACAARVERICDDDTHLLLAHNPKCFLRAAELGVPLTLSGHTHGGQVALKNRPNANLAIAHRHRAGLFRQGAARLFVTRGVGAWFPLRVNCPAEVAIVTMRSGVERLA